LFYSAAITGTDRAVPEFDKLMAFVGTAPSAQDNGYADENDMQAVCCTRRKAVRVNDDRRGAIVGQEEDVSALVVKAADRFERLEDGSEALKKAYEKETTTNMSQMLKVGEQVIITAKVRSEAQNGDRGVVKSMKKASGGQYIDSILIHTQRGADVRIKRTEQVIFEHLNSGASPVAHKVRYFPVIPAKCITIARVQGMQILRGAYHVFLENIYQHGMILVALSRSDRLPSIDFCGRRLTRDTKFADPDAVEFDEACEKVTAAMEAKTGTELMGSYVCVKFCASVTSRMHYNTHVCASPCCLCADNNCFSRFVFRSLCLSTLFSSPVSRRHA
jgi:hypothetical protein